MKKIAKLLGFLGFCGAALGGVLLSDAHAATPCDAGYYGMGQGTTEGCTACPSPYTNSASGYNRYEAMCYESCGTTCEDVSNKYATTTAYGLPTGYTVNTSLGTSTQVLFQSLDGLVSCSNLDGMCPLIVTCDSSFSSNACKISWKSVEFLDLNGEVIGKPLYIAFGHFWSSQKVQGGYDTGTGTSISYSAFYPVFDTPTAPTVANRPFLGYSRTYDPNGTMTIPAESSYNHGKLTSANAFATVNGVSGDTVTLRAVYACEPGYEWNNGNCEPMSYKVGYNCNNGTSTVVDDSVHPVFGGPYTVQGSTVDITACTPPVQGTQIIKWQITDDNGGTDEYAPGDQITWGYTVNTTFTAVWGQTTYNITYHPNGGTGGSGNHPATYDVTNLPLSITWVPERSHSVFEGWCKRENLTECSAIPYEIPSGTTGDIDLYAKWSCDPGYMLSGNSCVESNELPVRYECGDGATGGPATDTATYLGSYTVRGVDYATCSKPGYTFGGWAFSGGGLYYGGNVINSWIYTTEQTFTAKWTANEYRIDYKNMAHSAPVSGGMPDSYEYGVGATINGTPSLANGSFEKWCRDANLTDCAMPLTIATNETGDKVLWAKWKCATGFTLSNDKDSCEANTYTVTYQCGAHGTGTNVTDTATYHANYVVQNSNVNITCTPDSGYEFTGWKFSGDNRDYVQNDEIYWEYANNSETLTAQWDTATYTIQYENMTNATAAQTGMPANYTYGVGATIDGVPTRANSEFGGWCTDETLENCAMTQTIGTTATGDKTFWANWECLPPYHSNANGTACVACEAGYYWNGTDCTTACPPEYPYSRSPYNWSIDQCYNYCDTATCESYNVSGFPNGYTAEPIDSSSKQITFYGNARNGINACDGTVKYCAYGFASTPGALPSTLYKPMTVPVDFYGHMPQENLGTLYIFGSRAGGSSIDINTGDVWSQIVGPGQQTPVINNTQTGLTYQYTPIFYPADMAPNADVTGYTFDGYYYPENGSTQYVGSDYVLNATNALAVINSGQTGGYNIPRKLYATMNHGYSLGCYKVSFNNSWHGGTPTTSTLSFYKKGTSWYAGTDSNCTGTPIANPSVANELPTKTNATFTGYYDESGPDLMIFDANGTATMYANIWTITSDTTLYAQYTCDANAHQTSNDACVVCTAPTACWDNNTEQCVACAVVDHTITLDKNVGGLQGDDSSPSILYTVEGQGVYTDLATENPFTALTAVPTKYAIVTFNHCDGTNGACDSTANTETKNSDFPFVGFYDATSAINVISNNGNLTNDGYTNAIGLHDDATWHAHWGEHGMIAHWPQNPTRSGYNFVAWKDEPNCTGNTMTSTSYIDTDTTLYACWTMNTSYECQVYCDVALSTCPYQNASCEYDETQYQSGHNNGVSGAPCLDDDGHEIVAVACPISNVSCTQAGYIWVSTDEQCEQCTCTLGTGVDTCTPSSVGNQCTATGSCATGYVNFTPNCSGTTCEPYCGANTFTVNYECGTHGAAASGYDMYNTATYGAGYKVAHQSYTSSNVIALCNPNTGYVLANPTWKLEGTSYTGNTGDVIGSWQYSMSAPKFIAQYDCDTANFWFHNSSSDTCVLCNGANEYWNSTTESCGQCGAGTYPNAAHDACINEGQYEITLNKNVNSGAVHGIDGQTTLYTVHNTGVYRDAARTAEMTTAGNPLTEGNLPKKYAIVTFNHCDVDNDILCTNPANTEDVVNAYFAFNGFYQDTTTGSKYINEYGYITDGANGGMTVGAGYTDNNHVWYAHWAAQGILNGFPANPTRAGYTFVEWRTLPNGMGTVVPNNQTYTVTADTTLYANWAANAYDIHYVLNGGENYHGAPTSYSYGTGAQINGTPTRDNSQFIGWCDDAALTQNCDKVRVISGTETGGKTFYAKWACDCGYSATQNGQGCVANTITVNYQSEYGTVPASGTCTYNDVNGFTLASAIDAQGHDFSGWAMNYQRFNAGQTVACNYTTFGVCNGSVNANAIWGEANTYRIDYIMNGGVNYDGAPTSYMYGIGAQINGTPTRDNSQFVAWCDDANLKVNCARNKIIDSNDSGNKVFYAKWSCDCGYAPTSNAEACDANTIILNYNNGGHGNAQVPAAYCTYGNNFQLYNAISATGYEFSGWSVNNDTISAGATVACDNQTLGVCDSSVVISATWGTNTITLDWDENHGTEIPNGSCQYGDTLALASELPNRTGYTFSGWELVNSIVKAAGTTVSLGCTETYTGVTSGTSHGIRAVWCHNCIQPAVQNVCSLNTEGPGDCVYTYTECPQGYTLYIPQEAPWNPSCVQNQYTITYSANGGTGADQTQNVFFGSTFVTRPRSIFTNSGYMLTKWRIADATATYDPDTSYTYDINGNTTLEATWERCTCSYAGNSGVQACDPYSTANSTCGGTATCLAHFVNPTVTCANDGPACTATCTECDAGYISVNDNCDPCDPGHYQSGNECPQCSGNTIAPNPGAASCTECPEYTLANAEHTQCLYCPTGSILVNDVCEQCTAGHYQSGNDCPICPGNTIATNPGATSCTECPEYTVANQDHTACVSCPAGSILVNGVCEQCAAGTYQSGNSCVQCPAGKTSYAGATSINDCFIDPGTCAPDEHVEQGECVSNTKECTVPHATSAKREWNASIGTYGPCVVETCDEANGYRVSGNACVKDSCVVEHGSAETEWNVADNRWECIVTKCDPGYERSADDKSCVECYNRRVDGEIAVSSYVSECEIAACMYQGQKYTLDGNECRLICEEKTDETGSMIWDNIRKQCVRTCNKGYKMW